MKELTGTFLYIASPDHCADLRHATGFSAPDPLVLLIHKQRQHLVVSDLEAGRARVQLAHAEIWTPRDLNVESTQLGNQGVWAKMLLQKLSVGEVLVQPSFPLASARILEEAAIRVDVSRTDSMRPQRLLKTDAELSFIRRAQKAAVAGMRSAAKLIKTSEIDRRGFLRQNGVKLTSEKVRAAIREAVLKLGCLDIGTIVAGGRQGADPHEAGTGPLKAGQFIVIDIFPRHLESGYWGDITRTFIRGEASTRQKAMYDAVLAAQTKALAQVKDGASGAEIHANVADSLESSGFETAVTDGFPQGFIHSTGHGVGLEIHEAPSLSRVGGILSSGMVVTVEPGLYYHDLGGVRIEDTVVVTGEGFEYLARCPYF